jgi:hypothetical protein
MQINYDEILRYFDYAEKINSVKLKDIEWVRDDGSKIEIKPKLLELFRYVGVTNLMFAEMLMEDILAGKQDELIKELDFDR